jgi:putative intracellular protease/amidase
MSHVLVVCARQYNGHELWVALGVMQSRGHTFDLISTGLIIEDEVTHERNRIEKVIDDVKPEDADKYDGFMVVSGNMKDTETYWRDSRVLSYVEKFNSANKPIAAICCSVPTIRFAATGKKVSFFPLIRSGELLKREGALLQTVALTRDQNLVTAEHQMASQIWTEEFCNLLEGKPQQYFLSDSGFVPRGRERKPIPAVEAWKQKKEKS